MSSVFKWYNIVRILINETLQAGKSICSRLASSIQTTLEQLIYNVLRFILLGEVGNSFLTTWLIHFTVAFTIVIVAYVAKFLRKIDYPSFDEAEDDVDLPTCWVDWSAAWNDNTPVELDLPTASKLQLEREVQIMELLVLLNLLDSCVSGDDFVLKRLTELQAIHRIPCINLQFPFPIASRNNTNASPLMIASKLGHVDIVKLLLLHPQIDVNHAEEEFGITALMTACYTNRLSVVKVLLEAPNIKYNHQGKIGWSALLGACTNSNMEVVEILLTMPNIDVNAADDEGFTGLIWAVRNNHVEIVKMLLAHPDTNVNAQTNFGVTAYKLAQLKGYRKIQAVLQSSGKCIDRL